MSNSNITRIISPKVFGQIKEKARKLKRSQNIKLHQAQEIVAKEANFDNWNLVTQAHKIAELFYNSFFKGIAIGLSRDGFYDQYFSEECESFYTKDKLSLIYELGKEDIHNYHPKFEIYEGKKEYYTDEDLEEFTMMAGVDVAFYAYNGKINLNDKMGSIFSVIDCLGGDTPKYMWFNGEYIDINLLLENNEEVKLRCSQNYNHPTHTALKKAFSVRVVVTDKLNFHTFEYYEKNELFVASSSRLSRNNACLNSRELAEQYKDAITKRRIKSGDKRFEAEVVTISSVRFDNKFLKQIENDSKIVLEKINKWK